MREEERASSPAVVSDDALVASTTADWERTPPAVAVVEALEAATGRAATDLPPLAEWVEMDSLSDLVRAGTPSLLVQFRYETFVVTVGSDGRVFVEER
ncbi:HalOD1 output domain-containing protein [Halobaculum litoreum]|uniref:HalOD1 output domain-containing protein n=1 Tax=Halobaculum litoreum TaxID=3031998 RepID=A0ABD5Y144_9EURY